MDRNTLLAVVLSAIVITVGLSIQSIFFSPEPVETPRTEVAAPIPETPEEAPAPFRPETVEGFTLTALGDDPPKQTVTVDNGVFTAAFSTAGAFMQSLKLNEHLDQGVPVEAIFSGPNDPGAFLLYLGNQYEAPVTDTFHVRRVDNLTVEFYRDFSYIDQTGEVSPDHFTITKRFTFKPQDYLFEMRIHIRNSVRTALPLDFAGFAYTTGFEPQVGPTFDELDNRYEYRRFYTYAGGKKDSVRIRNGIYSTDDFLAWTSLAGKYFTVIGIPDTTRYQTILLEGTAEGIPSTSRLLYSRPAPRSSEITDVFRFYIGPQQRSALTIYNRTTDNEWGLRDMNLEEAMDASTWFGWLENILKFFLDLFYRLVPNYGVAIILLTLLIKVVLYPITRKSFQSTAKMQALNPKMQEIRTKHKDNPKKMNQEVAELYKREGVNPLGAGCLPMLLQFPIFIALYGLLNKHFELRGAVFIPGWITDLSQPDTIFSFAPAQIPIVGWSDIRLLPIIYLGTMILSFKFTTQSTAASGPSQMNMKFMTYGMPVVLFFVLYSAPSGLLLYWTVMNLVSTVQQRYITQKSKHKTETAESAPSNAAKIAAKGSEKLSAAFSKGGGKKKKKKK